jgi:short subunit dehydrogenase-like uncharacterized protein
MLHNYNPLSAIDKAQRVREIRETMAESPSVFVYGATGYTGRLICQNLAERRIPFIAGGRNLAKAKALCEEFPGSPCQAMEVEHSIAGLRHAFASCEVVINCTGPFGLLGMTVVKAALEANCHYLDTTGEQDFMLEVKESMASLAEERERVVVTGNSWYYALGACAAEICLSKGSFDDLTLIYIPRGKPTLASLQSLLRTARRRGFYLVDQTQRPNRSYRRSLKLPISQERVRAMTIPTGEAVYYLGDPRVRNVKGHFVAESRGSYSMFSIWYYLAKIFGDRIDDFGDDLVQRFYTSPPAEDAEKTKFVVAALAQNSTSKSRGPQASVEIHGSAPYRVTGFLCAEAASRLLAGEILQRGVISTADAFGADSILQALATTDVITTVNDGRSISDLS